MNYNTEDNIKKCLERFDEIEHLSDNWDGYGAVAPDKVVCDNARTFFDTMREQNCLLPHYEEITATPYGTIVIDVYPDAEDKDLISIEIGTHQCGFFTDYTHGINSGSDGYNTDFKHIPYFLYEHINLELLKMNKFLKLRKDDLEFKWMSCNGQFEIVKWFPNKSASSENDEYCIMIASFKCIDSDGNADLQWCGRRPLELSKEEFADFLDLVRFGYDEIKKIYSEKESSQD